MAFEPRTADLCDHHGANVQVAEPIFADFGGIPAFYGEISTVKCFEDNSAVRAALETAGEDRVLVVDGGGSRRCALLGDQLAALAEKNRWAGVIVYGCIRDSVAIAQTALGVKALATHPCKSDNRGDGQRDVDVHFAAATFRPGEYVYADEDGIIISSEPLHHSSAEN